MPSIGRRRKLVLAFLSLSVCALGLQAEVEVSDSTLSAFSADLLPAGSPVAEAGANLGLKNDRDPLQTFRFAENREAAAFHFGVRSLRGGETVRFRLWDLQSDEVVATDAVLDDLNGAHLVREEVYTIPVDAAFDGTASGETRLLSWALPAAVVVQAGRSYAVQLDDDGSPTKPLTLAFNASGPESYAEGAAFRDNGTGLETDIYANGDSEGDIAMAVEVAPASGLSFAATELLHEDTFEDGDLDPVWVPETESTGAVTEKDGKLVIASDAGSTVWFGNELQGDLLIRYDVTVVDENGPHDRVSDLNCFWMATDTAHPDDFFARSEERGGTFANYHPLRLYYVGFGGNDNSTTRFRRYPGDGSRPLLGEYSDAGHLLEANRQYRVEIVRIGDVTRYRVDGEVFFEYTDPDPFVSGYFGFRALRNRLRVERFQVFRLRESPEGSLPFGGDMRNSLEGEPWERHRLHPEGDPQFNGADGVRVADVNGDTLPDVAVGFEEGGTAHLFLHPGFETVRTNPWQDLPLLLKGDIEDAFAADLDGDGFRDLITLSEGITREVNVRWAPSSADNYTHPGKWGAIGAIPAASAGDRKWMFGLAGDVDGQNGRDLVVGGKADGAVSVAEIRLLAAPSDPRDLPAWTPHFLGEVGWVMSLRWIDMDADGDDDLLLTDRYGARAGARWLENPGPAMATKREWRSHPIGAMGEEVMFLDVADLDGDGLGDLVVPVKDGRTYLFRREGLTGDRWAKTIIEAPLAVMGPGKSAAVADVDLDGMLEILLASGQDGPAVPSRLLGLRWNETLRQWVPFSVSGPEGTKFDRMEILDIDGDGDLDVLTTEEFDPEPGTGLGAIWYENPRIRADEGFAEWIVEGNNPAVGPGEDADGNGLSNIVQYALGYASPRMRGQRWADRFSIHSHQGTPAIRFYRDPAASDVLYLLEASEDMAAWQTFYDSRNHSQNADGDYEAVPLSAFAEGLFIRLRVVRHF